MKLATYDNSTLDGQLMVVSKNLQYAVDASSIAPDLISALQRWQQCEAPLQKLYEQLNSNGLKTPGAARFDTTACLAPLPRSPQWLDGSAFLNHGRLMEKAFNSPPIPLFDSRPVMYQGASDDFLSAHADVPMPSEAHGIDFEGEFGVVTDAVPMGINPQDALAKIRLIVLINDWSLRALGPHEMKTGFGFLQAKPSSSFAPVAVTPDELASSWVDGRVHLNLQVMFNGAAFGRANGREMHFSFGDLIAHAATSRRLTAGCIVGSGTVSNQSRAAGSSCIAERRVIEMIDEGAAKTGFMKFGDRVQMQAMLDENSADHPIFGIIDQKVVRTI